MATQTKRPKPKDTIQKFETMAEHKYQTGLNLIDRDDYHTGIEQLGYAAEMFLKSAYLRFMKVRFSNPALTLLRTTSHITDKHLQYAKGRRIALSMTLDPESNHSLLFWATLLVAERKSQADPVNMVTENLLLSYAKDMHLLWMVEYRYQPKKYDYNDVLRMRASVTWLRENHKRLWR